MNAESRRVVTSPGDSFVTRTRVWDVARRVVSVCAEAVWVTPTTSATATAPA